MTNHLRLALCILALTAYLGQQAASQDQQQQQQTNQTSSENYVTTGYNHDDHSRVTAASEAELSVADMGRRAATVAPSSQTTSSQQAITTKNVPVLRPSIEEVASELSRKYLNLERHKISALPEEAASSGAEQELSRSTGTSASLVSAAAATKQQATATSSHQRSSMAAATASSSSIGSELAHSETLYLHLDTTQQSNPSRNSTSKVRANQYSRKRKFSASNHQQRLAQLNLQQQRLEQQQHWRPAEDDDLLQCQEYLQLHSSAFQEARPVVHSTLGKAGGSSAIRVAAAVTASQLLPCSCETGWHFATPDSNSELTYHKTDLSRVWLNCDNIQLIGSQLFTPHFEQRESNISGSRGHRELPHTGGEQHTSAMLQFSQRDADLQVLFSQKFYYLRLSSLRSIDLSRNRLRVIKMDAFHGIENKLEYLNLADNFLGDSRAMFDHSGLVQPDPKSSLRGAEAQQNAASKSVFFTDELNRLKALKWLSLRNNQINQLGANIFVKPQASGPATSAEAAATEQILSELLYLDLSQNLLKTTPSEAIHSLAKLQVLKLNDNKIVRLDKDSKFPASIKYLDLSNNLIDTVRQCSLLELSQLVELNLSNNQLRRLDQTAFVAASSLSHPAVIIAAADQSVKRAGEQASLQTSGGSRRDTRQLADNLERVKTYAWNEEHAHGDLIQARKRRQASAETPESDEIEPLEADESSSGHENDLDAVESIFSALTERLNKGSQATLSEELVQPRVMSQLNATLKLNLSRNLFESIPGDSLLKFTNLQVLDLSQNRIRQLDSNYLCSIYNLVDNLRYLDLSGNLLSLSQTQRMANQVHLNKLFGCLQRLEQLLLSTNRLAVNDQPGNLDAVVASRETNAASDTNEAERSVSPDSRPAKLVIKFGDNQGSRSLITLDLSDNRLDSLPTIEQVAQQPIQPMQNLTTDSAATQLSSNQAQLDQWMSSRMYLEVLSLNYNNIERIEGHELEHLYNLRQLHLDFNKLTSLPSRFMHRFTSLDQLSLAGNRISTLEPLSELLERSTRTLRVLNLANNRLVDWPKASTGKQMAIDGTVGATSNGNTNQPANADEASRQAALNFVLEELNLEGNLLTSANVSSLFDQLVHMPRLATLNLCYNLLAKIRSEWFKFANKNLRRLLLTGNKINSIELGAFAANQVNELYQLSLDYNLLKELKRKTFDSLPRLRELNLGHNLIHTINSETFHQLNSLQVLRLDHNKLTSWKCEYFSHLCNSISGNINVDLASLIARTNQQQQSQLHLQLPLQQQQQQQQQQQTTGAVSSLVELDLSHNSLSQLRANSISVHTKLVKLNLSHNKLSFIPHDLFKATTSILNGDRQVHLISSLKYLNLAFNRIQTVDNINFKPLKNLLALDLSFNELQTLGLDVVDLDTNKVQQADTSQRRLIVSNNLTNLLVDTNDAPDYERSPQVNQTHRLGRSLYSTSSWPALSKLRTLNLAHNSLSMINQSLLTELSPFVALNLNLSHNYLDSVSLPAGFFAKISSSSSGQLSTASAAALKQQVNQQSDGKQPLASQTYDLVFTLKLESLDLSHNRLNEWPGVLLDNHHSSMEACNLAHNRIQNLPQNSNSMIQIKSLNLEFNPLARETSELLLFEPKSARHLNLAATRLYAIQQATADNDQYSRSVHQLKSRLVNQTSQLDLIRSISKPIEAPYLRHLNLSSNQLVWLAANVFDKLHSLQTLDLSNNQLTRLHLLSNQLTRVAPTLEHLFLGSNLFTSIDATDFNQLTRIRQLDLSNLLSLQKLNCRFLAKLGTLTHLRMFNYPQLRNSINQLIANLKYADLPDRLQQKVRNELIASTMGGHCFEEARGLLPFPIERQDHDHDHDHEELSQFEQTHNWYKIEQLELELFNNFHQPKPVDSFTLGDQLRQLLSPSTRKLALYGLNLTSLSDTSLLGITSDELEITISYTSISQLPLRQILTSLAKRTRLRLDLRHNNIQSIDTDALQWLDELQQVNLASPTQTNHLNDEPFASTTLRLASNPFRCDCQTRPLWLWLNQRWDNPESVVAGAADNSYLQLDDTSTGNSANYWLKFYTISQANDLKCFYPLKLRGKLAQHVHYNDLVCKGSGAQQAPTGTRPLKPRRNDSSALRSSDSYYLTASLMDTLESEELEDDDYGEPAGDNSAVMGAPAVRITRFNRYPSAISNVTSVYFLTNFPSVPFTPDGANQPQSDRGPDGSQASIRKRDENSLPDAPPQANAAMPAGQVNTKYTKHRPNTHQKHAHFSTMTNLNSAQFGRTAGSRAYASGGAAPPAGQARGSTLTDSDIMILTVASIAMTIMSLIIISVCLFKFKVDYNDQEHILSTHSKLVLTQALFAGKPGVVSASGPGTSTSSSSAASSPSSASSSKRSSSKSRLSNGSPKQSGTSRQHTNAKELELSRLNGGPIAKPSQVQPRVSQLPMVNRLGQQSHTLLAPATQNFLMRSPTIRRMHGLANNASDWFKCTLRAYPSAHGARRRRLFIQNNAICGSSQLSTSKLAGRYNRQQLLQGQPERHLTSALLASGCPKHAFLLLEGGTRTKGGSATLHCLHCVALMRALKQCKSQQAINPESGANKRTGRSEQILDLSQLNGGDSERRPLADPTGEASNLTFQATIEQQGGFMPPKMIQALARRLDERHNVADSNSRTRRQLADEQAGGDSFNGRDSKTRAMRTFGRTPASMSLQSCSSSARVQEQANSGGGGGGGGDASEEAAPSQIPTIDVDGRFAYQSDSHMDSPYGVQLSTGAGSQLEASCGGTTPTSTVATGQEDIFVLFRDTPTSGAASSLRGGRARDESAGLRTSVPRSTGGHEESGSTVMQDECSRTSSPIAYGFMRSSPSATTLSSSAATTLTHSAQNNILYTLDGATATNDATAATAESCDSPRSRANRTYKLAQNYLQSVAGRANQSRGSSFLSAADRRPTASFKSKDHDANNNSNNNNNSNHNYTSNSNRKHEVPSEVIVSRL